MRLRRLLPVLPLPLLLLALLPASARADGPPVTARDAGPEGVVELGGRDRFTAVWTTPGTVLTRSQVDGGRVVGAAVVRGSWGVPVVANDGSSGGVSADGSTLVLMRMTRAYPRRHSSFALVGTKRLAIQRTIELNGDWGFDAVSPDGSTVYLIQTSRRDSRRYSVRAYDVRAGRLLRDPIVDASEPDEPMRGLPVTRTTGPGGRWEYTLYAGGEHPFIHALDTVKRESRCLDLPRAIGRRAWIWDARLAIRGSRVQVVHGKRVVASASREPEQASAGGGPAWAAALLVLTGALAAAGIRRAIRR